MNLEAIDKAVAEVVMGLHLEKDERGIDAWFYRETMMKAEFVWSCVRCREHYDMLKNHLMNDAWSYSIKWLAVLNKWTATLFKSGEVRWGEAESLESERIAFCLAALQAHGVDINEFE